MEKTFKEKLREQNNLHGDVFKKHSALYDRAVKVRGRQADLPGLTDLDMYANSTGWMRQSTKLRSRGMDLEKNPVPHMMNRRIFCAK